MKKTIVIEIEETITETRVVVPGNIHCPACGAIVSLTRREESLSKVKRVPTIETISISPERAKVLGNQTE